MRKCWIFFVFVGLNLLFSSLMFVHAYVRQNNDEIELRKKREIVRKLELSDLSLFTDARYTRHPSMADLNTPFQDYPLSLEHFPSGSLLSVPPHLKPHKPR